MRTKQESASLYLLADLVGQSVGRFINNKNKLPGIEEVFPGMFDEIKAQPNWTGVRKRMQLYASAKETIKGASGTDDD